MRTIETTASVNDEGILTVRVPVKLPPGIHRVVLLVEEGADSGGERFELPLHRRGPWPADLSLRREDMYDEWGR